jgi:hypothetical protein
LILPYLWVQELLWDLGLCGLVDIPGDPTLLGDEALPGRVAGKIETILFVCRKLNALRQDCQQVRTVRLSRKCG